MSATTFNQTLASGVRTILIIEDDELNREMLTAMLEDKYHILQAENGRVGLDVLHDRYRDVSLIVLDMQMPVMNGYEFLREVKSDSLLRDIPVLVCTGNNSERDEEKCLEMGAADFVTKPYNRHIVLSRIWNIIRLRESASTLSEVEYDHLTGIYTRQAFFHHATRLLRMNPETSYDLMVSEIEDYELVMELQGKSVCDRMVKRNCEGMLATLHPDSVCGRYNESRFICLVKHNANATGKDVPQLKFNSIDDGALSCNLKFGIVMDVDHSVPVRTLANRAIVAMKQIRHIYGKAISIYDDELASRMEYRKFIEDNMQEALRNNQFCVYYQPKHEVATGKLVGAEALIRWIHPVQGFMSPGDFIPVFEQSGFVVEADHFVWKHTCENQARWEKQGLHVVPISVNCSRAGLMLSDFYERWMLPLWQTGVKPENMHLEVTESLFANRMERVAEVLERCRAKGVKIELDDFGTGYSSLSSLEILPLDMVKFDMAFMNHIDRPRKLRVLAACVSLAHNLNLTTIAEGVENEQQVDVARQIGIDIIQGYYYSKPLTEQEFEEYLINNKE